MENKRETDLWKQIDGLIFIVSILGLIILVGAYFIIANLENIDTTLRELILSVITNIIPTFLLFIGAYLVFRRIEKLRSERDADEIADKVILRFIEFLKFQSNASGENNSFIDNLPEISESYLKLSRELEVTVKPFEAKSNPQALVIECLYRGRNIIRIKKVSYSGSKLGISDLSKEYNLDDNGHRAVIPHEKHEVISGEKFSIQLSLAKKWNKETIEDWFGKLGYLHFEIEDNNVNEDLQKAI